LGAPRLRRLVVSDTLGNPPYVFGVAAPPLLARFATVIDPFEVSAHPSCW